CSRDPLHPGDVVPVAVAEDDCLDVAEREAEPPRFPHPPCGEPPVSNSNVCPRPSRSTETSAEKPGSATSASGTPSGVSGVATRGTAPASAFGQPSLVTSPWSGISGSVTLSI